MTVQISIGVVHCGVLTMLSLWSILKGSLPSVSEWVCVCVNKGYELKHIQTYILTLFFMCGASALMIRAIHHDLHTSKSCGWKLMGFEDPLLIHQVVTRTNLYMLKHIYIILSLYVCMYSTKTQMYMYRHTHKRKQEVSGHMRTLPPISHLKLNLSTIISISDRTT